jgi:hypothetical protein
LQVFQKERRHAIRIKQTQAVHAAVRELMGIKYGRDNPKRLNVSPSYDEELVQLEALSRETIEYVLTTVDKRSLEIQTESNPALWISQFPNNKTAPLFSPVEPRGEPTLKIAKSIGTYPGSGSHALVFGSVVKKNRNAPSGYLERIHEKFKGDLEASLRTHSGLAYHFVSEMDENAADPNAFFAIVVLCAPDKCKAVEDAVQSLLALPSFNDIGQAARVIELIPEKAYPENTTKPQAM